MNGNSVINNIKEKGNEALGEIYIEYREEFISWLIKQYRCDYDTAKDIYQLVIIIFYDNVRQGKLTELRSNLKTYLFAIGKNKYFEHLKKNSRFIPKDNFLTESGSNGEEIQEKQEKEVQLDQLEESLLALGDPCQCLLKLFYYEKKSMEEITKILNYKNRETTKNQKYKCLNRLRKIHFKLSLKKK